MIQAPTVSLNQAAKQLNVLVGMKDAEFESQLVPRFTARGCLQYGMHRVLTLHAAHCDPCVDVAGIERECIWPGDQVGAVAAGNAVEGDIASELMDGGHWVYPEVGEQIVSLATKSVVDAVFRIH